MNQMVHTERYELIFQMSGAADDVVRVRLTDRLGAGGFPVYEDETGIVRAEISDRGEVRMLASGGHQVPGAPLLARPLVCPRPGRSQPRPFMPTRRPNVFTFLHPGRNLSAKPQTRA